MTERQYVVNPASGRPILVGGHTYNKLMTAKESKNINFDKDEIPIQITRNLNPELPKIVVAQNTVPDSNSAEFEREAPTESVSEFHEFEMLMKS